MKKKIFIFISMMLLVLPFSISGVKAVESEIVENKCKFLGPKISESDGYSYCVGAAVATGADYYCGAETDSTKKAVCYDKRLCAYISIDYSDIDYCNQNTTESERKAILDQLNYSGSNKTVQNKCEVYSNGGKDKKVFHACENAARKIGAADICEKITDTVERSECYDERICSLLLLEYPDVSYCLNHTSDQDRKNVVNEVVSSDIAEICEAAVSDHKGQSFYSNYYTGCKNSLAASDCNLDRQCLLNKACSMYPSSAYCKTSLPAYTYNQLYEKSKVKTEYKIEDVEEKKSSGTINDDLDRMEGYNAGNCYGFGEVVYYVSLAIRIFQVCAPILLIIWASVDLLKSVIAGDEKKIIEMRKPIIKRFISAALVFLVPWMVETLIDSFAVSKTDAKSWFTCWKNYRYGEINSSSVHQSIKGEEMSYISNSCKFVCAQNEGGEDCQELCIEDYLVSDDICYYAVSSDGDTSKDQDAKQSCYNKFTQSWIKSYKKKK